MLWWVWIIFGFAFVLLEVFLPTSFFALFFGISAIITGIVLAIIPSVPDWMPWILFSFASVILILLFRQRLRSGEHKIGYQDLVNETVTLSEDIVAGEKGSGELRGTVWTILNTSDTLYKAGSTHAVKKVTGLTIEI